MSSAIKNIKEPVNVEAFEEIYNKHSDKMICSKQDISNVASAINYFEKKKMNVSLVPMPVQQNDGIKMTYAFIMPIDKKIVKKNKKSISNNKYILFNSWYTKTKLAGWPTSPAMWNSMKEIPQVKSFIGLFDYMEKLGKVLKKEVAATIADQNNLEKNEVDQTCQQQNENGEEKEEVIKAKKTQQEQQIELFNIKRAELYAEFYRVLNAAFHHNSAPQNSSVYDIKLPKTININGHYEKPEFEKLTRSLVQNAVETFKTLLQSITDADPAAVAIKSTKPAKSASGSTNSRKRKNSHFTGNNKHQKISKIRRDSYRMVNDDNDESQMSSS